MSNFAPVQLHPQDPPMYINDKLDHNNISLFPQPKSSCSRVGNIKIPVRSGRSTARLRDPRLLATAGPRLPQLLAMAARNMLDIIPASNTPSERAFSVAGRVLEPRMCLLNPSTIEDVVLLNGPRY